QTAHQAKLIKAAGQSKGQDKLILYDVAPYLLTFTTGKTKYTSFILNKDFIDRITQLKNYDKINAALLSIPDTNKHNFKKIVLSLHNPKYYPHQKQMAYDVNIIYRDKSTINFRKTLSLMRVVLFIDGICASCAGDNF